MFPKQKRKKEINLEPRWQSASFVLFDEQFILVTAVEAAGVVRHSGNRGRKILNSSPVGITQQDSVSKDSECVCVWGGVTSHLINMVGKKQDKGLEWLRMEGMHECHVL